MCFPSRSAVTVTHAKEYASTARGTRASLTSLVKNTGWTAYAAALTRDARVVRRLVSVLFSVRRRGTHAAAAAAHSSDGRERTAEDPLLSISLFLQLFVCV